MKCDTVCPETLCTIANKQFEEIIIVPLSIHYCSKSETPPAGAGGFFKFYMQKSCMSPTGCRFITRLESGVFAAQ